MSNLIETRGLTKRYVTTSGLFHRRTRELHAVDDVSLAIRPGETLGLVGESGSGKSTLGRLLIRLLRPTSGQIVFDGKDITDLNAGMLREARRSMQMIFQDPYGALDPRMSAEDIISEPLVIHGAKPGPALRKRIDELLTEVGLSARVRHRFPHEFSGGQRQRIGIARALALRPKFIICDEAVSALDVSIQAQIVNLLQDLQSELNLTYLFISHDLSVVKHISDRVAVMYLGKIVEIADRRTLYAAPQHPYTQALIAAVPVARVRRSRKVRTQLSGEIPSALDPPSGCRFHTRCPLVTPVCREREPLLVQSQPDHHVACHLINPV